MGRDPPRPQRPGPLGSWSFAFLPHRFLHDRFLRPLAPDSLRPHVLLVLAVDRYGVACYSHRAAGQRPRSHRRHPRPGPLSRCRRSRSLPPSLRSPQITDWSSVANLPPASPMATATTAARPRLLPNLDPLCVQALRSERSTAKCGETSYDASDWSGAPALPTNRSPGACAPSPTIRCPVPCTGQAPPRRVAHGDPVADPKDGDHPKASVLADQISLKPPRRSGWDRR